MSDPGVQTPGYFQNVPAGRSFFGCQKLRCALHICIPGGARLLTRRLAGITAERNRRLPTPQSARQRARSGGGLIEDEFLLVGSNNDWLAGMQIALEYFLGQQVFEKTFHRAAHGTDRKSTR